MSVLDAGHAALEAGAAHERDGDTSMITSMKTVAVTTVGTMGPEIIVMAGVAFPDGPFASSDARGGVHSSDSCGLRD
jgi:hypothetical protein